MNSDVKNGKPKLKWTSATVVSNEQAREINPWSCGKIVKIPVIDFYFNFRDVQWKNKTITVEYDLFLNLMKSWVAEGMSKEEALDLVFEMA